MVVFVVVAFQAVRAVVTGLVIPVESITAMIMVIVMNDDNVLLLFIVRGEGHSFRVSSDVHANDAILWQHSLEFFQFVWTHRTIFGDPSQSGKTIRSLELRAVAGFTLSFGQLNAGTMTRGKIHSGFGSHNGSRPTQLIVGVTNLDHRLVFEQKIFGT